MYVMIQILGTTHEKVSAPFPYFSLVLKNRQGGSRWNESRLMRWKMCAFWEEARCNSTESLVLRKEADARF